MKVLAQLVVVQRLGVALAQILAGRHEETGGAAGGIADDIAGSVGAMFLYRDQRRSS